METYNFVFKSGPGRTKTLDRHYIKLIKDMLQNVSEEKKDRWEVYNIIIEELLTLGLGNYFTELKYRITDGEDINHVLLDITNRDDVSHFLTLFNNRLKEFIEEDFYDRFF